MSKQNVEITLHETKLLFENCIYPEPTREQIADKLKESMFSYTEKRISADINIPTARFDEQRDVSSSVHGVYNANNDPFNE